MTGHPRLYRRGATYYHRAAVPQDIVETYGKREETFSLRTKEHAEAVRRVRIEAVRVDELFDAHRKKIAADRLSATQPDLEELSADQIKRAKQAYLHHVLDEDEEIRLEGFEDPDEPIVYAPRPTFEERGETLAVLDEANRFNLARGKKDAFFRSEAEEVLSWDGIELRLSKGSPSWPRLIRALQEASVEAMQTIRARDKGDTAPTSSYPVSAPSASSDKHSGPLLSEAVANWEAEKVRSAWSPKVRNDHIAWLTAFREIVGDQPITEYAKKDARAFKAILMNLPANWRKKPEVRNLSITEAAEKAEKVGLEPMSSTTLNKAIRRVGAFWNWAEVHYDNITPSLFKGLPIKIAVAARDQRHPFSSEQLNAIFNSPLFKGCRSERSCTEPGNYSMRDTARYWLPILGLYTGARLNELCQLNTEDIQESDGIAFIKITDDAEGQMVKSASGKRRIPVHPKLEEVGFLDFVAERKAAGSVHLFAELKPDRTGYRSGEFSKWFSRFLLKIGVKTAKTSFHSFRHNFEDACRNGGVQPHIMNALQGHAEQGMAARYGDGVYSLRVLREAIDCVEYQKLHKGSIST